MRWRVYNGTYLLYLGSVTVAGSNLIYRLPEASYMALV